MRSPANLSVWFGKFLRRNGNNYQNGHNPDFPLTVLSSYVGKPLIVYYLNCGEPQIVSCFLYNKPNGYSIDVMDNGTQRMIRIDATVQEQRDAIRMVLDENGVELYRNDSVPFDTDRLPKPRKVRKKMA